MKRVVAVSLAAAAAWSFSCYSATEIQLVLETDVPCDTVRARGVAIYVGTSAADVRDSSPVATTTECTTGTGGSELGTLSLVPSGDRNARVFVDVVIGLDKGTAECVADPAGCIVARRSPRYIPHTSTRLPMNLSQRCASVRCLDTETCEQGACVTLDSCGSDGCVTINGNGNGNDAGVGVTDAAVDAPADAGCAGGGCVPQTILSGIDMPTELAIAGDDLFVISDGADGVVVQAKTSGATQAILLVSHLVSTGAVAADATNLYFGAGNDLRVCDRPGCTNGRVFNTDNFSPLLLDATSLIGISKYNAYAMQMLRADGGTTLLTFTNPLAMAVDASEAFFYVDTGSVRGIFKCPRTGCVPLSPAPQLVSPARGVDSMALDDAYVYWAEADTGRVVRVAKNLGGPIEALTTTAKRPRSIVVDGAFAYWTEEGTAADDGLVMSAAKNGTAPVVLASGQHHPYRLATAGGRVFWTNHTSAGTVLSLPLR